MSIKKILGLAACLACASWMTGQTIHQQSYWFRVYARGKLRDKWFWHFEVDERRLIHPDRQLQFITHAHVHRTLGRKMEVSAGGSYSVVNKLPEWRLFQEWHFTHSISQRWRFASRLRTEERWLMQPDDSWKERFRLRCRLQLDYNLSKKWRAKLSNELMGQAGAFEQNRVYFGVEWLCSKQVTLETGYLKLYQKRGDAAYFDRDILRSSIYLNF